MIPMYKMEKKRSRRQNRCCRCSKQFHIKHDRGIAGQTSRGINENDVGKLDFLLQKKTSAGV
jgi:hypothetical protein